MSLQEISPEPFYFLANNRNAGLQAVFAPLGWQSPLCSYSESCWLYRLKEVLLQLLKVLPQMPGNSWLLRKGLRAAGVKSPHRSNYIGCLCLEEGRVDGIGVKRPGLCL